MAKLTIGENIITKTDKINLVKAELEKQIDIFRTERGCINYDLHPGNENSIPFLLQKNWESRDFVKLTWAIRIFKNIQL